MMSLWAGALMGVMVAGADVSPSANPALVELKAAEASHRSCVIGFMEKAGAATREPVDTLLLSSRARCAAERRRYRAALPLLRGFDQPGMVDPFAAVEAEGALAALKARLPGNNF